METWPVRATLRWHRRLTERLFEGQDAFVLFRTRTRIDTGRWGLRPRIRLCCLRRDLALFAGGKRPHAEKIPFAGLGESVYNHVTGELVLAPADGARVRRLKVTPLEGCQILAQIYHEVNRHA